MSRRRIVVTAVVMAGALALSACGTNREEGGGAAAGNCDTSQGDLVIGVIAPLSGDLSALGLGMRNSADLAVDQANANCTVPGYNLILQAEDDQALPQIAAQAGTRLASQDNTAAVIGTLNSSTAQTVQPIVQEANIVMISPANTNPTLTQGENADAPARPFSTYFRTATTDALQGPYAADYLISTAGLTDIAVINDGNTYGAGLAAAFTARARELGANIVAEAQVGDQETDFSGVLAQIRPSNPTAIYYGGQYPAAGPLSQQMGAQGLNVPLMGGDALYSADFISLGARTGDLATSVGAPVADLPSAQQFIADYEAANYAEAYEAYGALTYDATNVAIQGLATALEGGTEYSADTRQAVIDAVQATDLAGASGPVAFDEFGDTTNRVLTVYGVENGEFTTITTGEYAG